MNENIEYNFENIRELTEHAYVTEVVKLFKKLTVPALLTIVEDLKNNPDYKLGNTHLNLVIVLEMIKFNFDKFNIDIKSDKDLMNLTAILLHRGLSQESPIANLGLNNNGRIFDILFSLSQFQTNHAIIFINSITELSYITKQGAEEEEEEE